VWRRVAPRVALTSTFAETVTLRVPTREGHTRIPPFNRGDSCALAPQREKLKPIPSRAEPSYTPTPPGTDPDPGGAGVCQGPAVDLFATVTTTDGVAVSEGEYGPGCPAG